jgi:hypothetical protein
LHNEEFVTCILLQVYLELSRLGGCVGRTMYPNGTNGNMYRLLTRRTKRKGSLGKPRRRWVNNIKVDVREIV